MPYHYIYKITCIITGKFYIGAHSTNNLDDGYMGSGNRIKRSIKKHGKENHKLEILEFLPDRKSLMIRECKIVNEEMVKDEMCMNMITGGCGVGIGMMLVRDKKGDILWMKNNDSRFLNGEVTHIAKNKVSVKDANGHTLQVSKEDPRYLSGELVSVNKGTIPIKDINGNCYRIDKEDPRYLSGELIPIYKNKINVKNINGVTSKITLNDPRYLSGELVPITTGFVPVRDINGNTYSVSINDPRYLSRELVPMTTGYVPVRDKEGNTFQVSKEDPRYLSGEFVHVSTKRVSTEKTRNKMSKNHADFSGNKNGRYGTCYISNVEEKRSIVIKKEELEKWVSMGWIKGRKIKW
jgi:hypothetical protein